MFTSSASRNSRADKAGRRVERARAALFTRMSTRPKRSSVRRTISPGTSSAVTSPGTGSARPVSDDASASARAASRTLTATAAPRWSSRSAMARPRPRAAPVTIATRPLKSGASPSARGSALNRTLCLIVLHTVDLRGSDHNRHGAEASHAPPAPLAQRHRTERERLTVLPDLPRPLAEPSTHRKSRASAASRLGTFKPWFGSVSAGLARLDVAELNEKHPPPRPMLSGLEQVYHTDKP